MSYIRDLLIALVKLRALLLFRFAAACYTLPIPSMPASLEHYATRTAPLARPALSACYDLHPDTAFPSSEPIGSSRRVEASSSSFRLNARECRSTSVWMSRNFIFSTSSFISLPSSV
ncbi:hypothetical protein KC349_g197 [Hortaea werneckii]|nr:hypothetical protein KC349_g197 [Hortaea werneckii]